MLNCDLQCHLHAVAFETQKGSLEIITMNKESESFSRTNKNILRMKEQIREVFILLRIVPPCCQLVLV